MATIKNTYAALANYFQLPVGSGKGMSFDFNLNEFTRTYKLSPYTAFSSLKILELEGYIELTDEINNPTRIRFLLNRDDLYRFQVSNSLFDAFIKLLLRSYTGVFTDYTTIDEALLARRAAAEPEVVRQYLIKLSTLGVINYLPQKRTPLVIFHEERLEEKNLYISRESYQNRKDRYTERTNAMLSYAVSKDRCRSQSLLAYFGETGSPACGECDICREQNKIDLQQDEFNLIREEITAVLGLGALKPETLFERIAIGRDKILETLQWMMDNDQVGVEEDGRVGLKNK
jgi:ATP-dependent DNA helicase RecQ